jgi:hypothetical protein
MKKTGGIGKGGFRGCGKRVKGRDLYAFFP